MPLPDDADALPPRAQRLPITPAGYARLRRELDELGRRPAANEVGARRARVLAQVLASVDVVEPSLVDGRAGFGTRVTVEEPDGRRVSYDLVGPDEAELAAGQISIASPVAQALRGKRAGDMATVETPRGSRTYRVLSVS